MSNREYDEIHDYDYNNNSDDSDLTRDQISSDIIPTEPVLSEESENISPEPTRSMFSNPSEENNSSTIFNNETTMDMIQGNSNSTNPLDIEELKKQQNFPLGVVGGILASLVCVIIWTAISVITKYQIAYMAIGVGFVVGLAIQKTGKGLTPIYGVLGAILSLLTCFFGNFISIVCIIANEYGFTYVEAFSYLDLETSIEIITEGFQFMDVIFYGIAIYTGYTCSIKSTDQ